MIPVLIVDDEYLIRKLIIASVDWQKFDMEVVGEAEDGLRVFEVIEQCHPKLMILDINLPIKNGLELGEIISKQYPQIKIIIVTGFDDFKYIQQSMRLGVLDYIVKPIDAAELSLALEKARQEIMNTQLSAEQLVASRPMAKFQNILYAPSLDVFSANNDRFNGQNLFVYMALSIDGSVHEELEMQIALQQVLSACDAFLLEMHQTALGTIHHDKVILTVSKFVTVAALTDLCTQLIHFIKTHDDISISGGISNLVTPEEIETAVLQTEQALSQKFFCGYNKVHTYEAYLKKYPSAMEHFYDSTHIFRPLRNMDLEETQNVLHQLYVDVQQNLFCREYIVLLTAELIHMAIKFSVENGTEVNEIFSEQTFYLGQIQQCETIWELEDSIQQLFQKIISISKKAKLERPKQIINQIHELVAQQYHDPNLSLNSLAALLFLNPNYLSKIFKQITQQSLSEYIIQFRMNQAKQEFDGNAVAKIAEVASTVGYVDPFYFSKSFKKYFGVSPSKYCNNKSNTASGSR